MEASQAVLPCLRLCYMCADEQVRASTKQDCPGLLTVLGGPPLLRRYGSVRLSTHPPTHTPNMFSWFPIYFPLKEPVHVPAGAPIKVHMWRCGANHKVCCFPADRRRWL